MTPERARLVRKINGALDLAGAVLTLDDLIELARNHKIKVWQRDHTICAAEVIDYPQRAVLNCFLAAGDLADVFALEPEIEQFGREQGCGYMLTHGRRAWARVGARTGWRERSTEFIKFIAPLKDGGDT